MISKKNIPIKIIVACLLLSVSTVLLLGVSLGGSQSNKKTSKLAKSGYAEGEIIIKFKKHTNLQAREDKVELVGGHKLTDLDGDGAAIHVKLNEGQTVEDAIAAHRNDPEIEYIEPNYMHRISAVPNDTNYGKQWAMINAGQTISDDNGHAPYATNNPGTSGYDMSMQTAWNTITDSSSVLVAVLDTGVKHDHPDLHGNMWTGSTNHGYDYVNNDNDPMDDHGHGTQVAGIIGAVGNNSAGTTGVCWSATIMAIKVCDVNGTCDSTAMINGINYARTNGAKIINMSIAGTSFSQAMSDAIAAARTDGMIVIAPAGNEGTSNDTTPSYPCNYNLDNIVCVGAVDQSYRLSSFSNYGATSVDVAAPGANIHSTWPRAWVMVDDFVNSSGVLDWTIASGGANSTWGYANGQLVMPSNFDGSTVLYAASTTRTVYKTFNMTGKNNIRLRFYRNYETETSADYFWGYYFAGTGNPTTGTQIFKVSGAMSPMTQVEYPFSTTACDNVANCSIGFHFTSDYGVQRRGIAITNFELTTSDVADSYNTLASTSMAAAHVTGLAALIWAYNGVSTYLNSDVAMSVKYGGTDLPDATDSTKIASGKTVNGWGSLKYIVPPTGLSASKAP